MSRLSLPDENGTAEVAEGETGSVVGTEGTRSEDEGNRLFGTRRHFGDDPQQPQQQPQSTTSDVFSLSVSICLHDNHFVLAMEPGK